MHARIESLRISWTSDPLIRDRKGQNGAVWRCALYTRACTK